MVEGRLSAMPVHEDTIELDGVPVFLRRAPADDPPLFLHSVPTSSDDWVQILGLTGGVAPDLPGFGRSAKGGNLDYSLDAYATFLEAFLDEVGLERFPLVAHGWGAAIGLCFAQRHPKRVTRMALIDPLPLMEGFEWPAMVRWWRRPVAGELVMGSVNRWLLARTLRRGSAQPEAWPDARVNAVWEQFDQGTQRAILRLHRSVGEDGLAGAGAGLARLEQPVLLIWGEQDPWISATYADAYGLRLGNATIERVAQAGHWPWLDRPELTARLAAWALMPEPA